MKTNTPRKFWWKLSLVLGLVGIISYYVQLPLITINSFWVLVIAWLSLLLSSIFKGM